MLKRERERECDWIGLAAFYLHACQQLGGKVDFRIKRWIQYNESDTDFQQSKRALRLTLEEKYT